MAGRPKMMAKRMGALTNRVLELQNELLDLIPKQYQGAQTEAKPTELSAAWGSADDTMEDLTIALLDLNDLLDERAGIVKPDLSEEVERCRVAMEASTLAANAEPEPEEPEPAEREADDELDPGELEADVAGVS